MTQDFAKRKSSKSETKRSVSNTRKPAARSNSPSKKRPSASRGQDQGNEKSALVWFGLGVVCGLFISLLMFLAWQSQNSNNTASKAANSSQSSPKKVPSKPQASNKEPEFEFYNMLPDDKVVVDSTPTASTKAKKIYYLQASSFSSFKQADQVKARLILQGMDVDIRSSKSSSGKTWYKVVTGPYQTRSKMAAAKSKLVNQGLNPLVLSKKLDKK